MRGKFQSTRPIRGATEYEVVGHGKYGISIHAPHTGRDMWWSRRLAVSVLISIHAPHTGRDPSCWWCSWSSSYFNPRAPYGARRPTPAQMTTHSIFQSTRPIRGATRGAAAAARARPISIHAPHTGRDLEEQIKDSLAEISIHAPHTGRDDVVDHSKPLTDISIHAPHTGRDT